MTLRDRIKAAWVFLTKANPIINLTRSNINQDDAQDQPAGMESKLQAYEAAGWIKIASDAIAKNLSAAPLIVEQLQTIDGEQKWTQMDSGPLAEVMAMPNKQEPAELLLWRSALHLLNAGNAYWHFDRVLNEIWHIPAAWVKIVVTEDGPTGYVVENNGKKISFEFEDVIHFYLPTTTNEVYGGSQMEPAKQHIMLDYYGIRNLTDYFKNGGIPVGTLKSDQAIDSDTIKATRAEWNQIHTGTGNQNKIAILGQGLSFDTITPPLKDLVVDDLFKISREMQLGLYSCPPVVAGIFEHANYANSDQQIKLMWTMGIVPIMRVIQAILNLQLVPQFGENMRVRFDTSKIDAMREDQDKTATRAVSVYGGGLVTLNEAREMIGLDAVDDGAEFKPAPTVGQMQINEPVAKSFSIGGKYDTKGRVRDNHNKLMNRYERAMAQVLAKYFDGQVDRIMEKLNKITGNGKAMSTAYWAILKDHELSPGEAAGLFDIATENELLIANITPVLIDTTDEVGTLALDFYGIGGSFDVDNPLVQNMIAKAQNRSALINDNTFKQIKRMMKTAQDEGLGIDQLGRNIRAKYSEFSVSRAKMIARTEMNGVVNGASVESMAQNGVTQKRWLTAFVADTRNAHAFAHGETVGIRQPFVATGEPLQNPGDPSGSAWNTVNCLCTQEPVLETE